MSDGENKSVEVQPQAACPPQARRTRMILFALLALAVVGLIVDQIARKKAYAAFEMLNSKMGPEKKINPITRDEVHQLMGREPDDDGDPEDAYESFTWQGAIRPHRVYVQYRSGKIALLKDVSQNDPLVAP
jgi:hypothetical protein